MLLRRGARVGNAFAEGLQLTDALEDTHKPGGAIMRDQLTGRLRYRKGWRGRAVLQVKDMTGLVGIPPIREGRNE